MHKLMIHMFGEFSMKNEHHQLIATTSSSMQVIVLLTYLIANRESAVPKQKLIELLWPEDDCTNPPGALRNLVYRARKELANFFPDEKTECIILTRSAYYWNMEVPCDIDIYSFETYSNLAQREENPQKRFEYNRSMVALYRGPFLPLQSSEEWVVYRAVYYGRLFTQCVLSMVDYLKSLENYNDILQLCDHAIEIDSSDEDIHKEKLNALLKIGKVQLALEYYHQVTELFSQKYGIDITDSFHDIYTALVRALPNSNLSILTLEENLRDTPSNKGSFYCNFDIFKNIYQINLRSARRSQSRRYLVLLTLNDTKQDGIFTTCIRQEMNILYEVISKNLRSNDVFTQSSVSQISLILTVPNERGYQIALERVLNSYDGKKKHPNVELSVDVRQII